MTVQFKNHTIQVTAASTGYWQSEIRDSQHRLVGCTCDRAPNYVLNRAIVFVESLLSEPKTSHTRLSIA